MLPDSTLEQKIATAFNRNHRGNAEGGIIPEEYQVEYVVDRVETTFTVWQGLTMGCVRCHEHKYDPISQKEFYQVYAYFNNIPESGRAIKEGNSPPYVKAPTPDQQKQLANLNRKLKAAKKRYKQLQPQLISAQAQWEKTFRPEIPVDWTSTEGLIANYQLDNSFENRVHESKIRKTASGKIVDGDAQFLKGRLGSAASLDGIRFIEAGDVADFGYFDKFSFGAWIFPTDKRGGAVSKRLVDAVQVNLQFRRCTVDGNRNSLCHPGAVISDEDVTPPVQGISLTIFGVATIATSAGERYRSYRRTSSI